MSTDSELAAPGAIPARSRGQRRRTSQSRQAIIEAVRDLLTERRLDDLTVNEIVERAEISRPTFYSHFETKYSVIAALVADMGESVFDAWRPFFDGEGPIDEVDLRRLAVITLGLWREQGALFTATVEGWHSDQEIHDVWNPVLERFAAALKRRLTRWRPLTPADDLMAAALVSAFERCVYLAVATPESPLGRSDEELAGVLAAIWVRSLG